MANTMSDNANKAAWITEAKATPLKVDTAPMPSAGADEVVIKNKALAVNPVDWKIQDSGMFIQNYPNVLGTDVAGEIHEVGSNVKNFKKGDRVLSHCIGLGTGKPQNAGFQLFTACPEILTSKIPKQISCTEAVVLPLAISTASAGLYQKGYLELPYPTASPKSSGKVILVWGGSSSVGSTAIQLAVASGVQVITTASKHNHEYCSKLGAEAVIDYNSSSVVDDIVSAIKDTGAEFAGVYDSISHPETFKHCFEVLQKAGGSKNMATVLPPPQDKPSDLNVQGVFAITIANQHKEVGDAVWQKFVPGAIQSGDLKCLPEPLVVGQGLESVQKGLDKSKAGVSAKKVVIEL
ncbi:oxidoreductase-like protein [Aureobasidium subglaciale]|nr:oxidoreductase-like protein [Aureobasidium subglaciale]KAI5228101.1 oxidoreductase-like protein [Aureobasidium subglaciale]KAI5231533.1 oxidoreductase-like protein [Aureobasidium subglaciale]KAI5265579.1 oxidoreductase-like protein [Aureobasidium subglaciale]